MLRLIFLSLFHRLLEMIQKVASSSDMKSFTQGLNRCDASANYKELRSNFAAHVLPSLKSIVTSELACPLSPEVSPSKSCPTAASLREYLTSLEECDDVWWMMFSEAKSLLRAGKRDRAGGMLETVAANCFTIFGGRGLPKMNDVRCRWKFLVTEKKSIEEGSEYLNSNGGERRKMQLETALAMFSERSHRQHFSAFWDTFLTDCVATNLHLHVLHVLPSIILPNISNPLNVADYLFTCFKSGGLVAVLALQGIFLLMLDHGLEYTQFYDQLYSLLTPDAFSSRHRNQLFQLVELCMKSLRVPGYIAAAFIKKVARISLASPAPTLYFALPFLRKLLQLHPNCLCLIHRTTSTPSGSSENTEDMMTESQRSMSEKLVAKLFDGEDPFQGDATSPLASQAISSTLWELTLLQRHFLPAVPLMVSAFSSPAEDTAPLRFDKTYGRLFTAEVTKEINTSRVPPLDYQAPRWDASGASKVVVL